MSAASQIAFTGLSAARKQLAELAAALRSAETEVTRAAVADVQALMERVARDKVGKHKLSGYAAGALEVTSSGSLVVVGAPRYLNYHSWWPFRRGVPRSIIKAASVIFARKLVAHLGLGGYEGAELAGEVAAAADASDAAKAKKASDKAKAKAERKAQRAEARAKAKAERKAARDAATRARREERKRQRQIAAQQRREERARAKKAGRGG